MRAASLTALAIAALLAPAAEASVTFYGDRATFNGAAAPTAIETFNGYAANVPTSPVAFDAGAFTIGVVGTPDASGNRIDVVRNAQSRPFDATPYLLARTNAVTQQVVINFDQSINAVGFDFADYNDLFAPDSRIFIGGTSFTPAIQPDNATGFFGFASDAAFNSVTFQTIGSVDGFGIDNIAFKTVVAPVTTYLDQALFDSVVGPLSAQNFDGIFTDTATSPVPLTIGDLTISVASSPDPRSNRIDVGRAADSRPVDASPYLLARTNGANDRHEIVLDFATPIDAIDFLAADFNDFIDPSTRITIAGQTFAPAVANSDAVTYFGFKSQTPFTQVRIDTLGFSVDAFGIDNLRYRIAPTAVPEPTTWAMFLAAFMVIGTQMRRRNPLLSPQ